MKNIIKSGIILYIALLWLPTGLGDLIFIPFIISKIGLTMYIIISIVLVIYLYNSIEGRTLGDKLKRVHHDLRRLIS